MTDNPWGVVAGTGHRKLLHGDPAWVAEQLPRAAVWLRDQAGTRAGISGLGYGFDLDWAEAVLDAGLELWVAIPFEHQTARWRDAAAQQRWARLRAAATRESPVPRVPHNLPADHRKHYINRLLAARNNRMLNAAGAVLTVWEPDRLEGGTASTLLEATRRQMLGVHLDPVARAVHFHLPAEDRLAKLALEHTDCGHVYATGIRADVDAYLTTLTAAGYPRWRIRPARPYEQPDAGCDRCQVDEPAARAAARAAAAGVKTACCRAGTVR